MEAAGPRKELFLHPSQLACGIVTCGGLCPGLNDVIRAIVLSLSYRYGVNNIFGFRFGYEGVARRNDLEPLKLTPGRLGKPDLMNSAARSWAPRGSPGTR